MSGSLLIYLLLSLGKAAHDPNNCLIMTVEPAGQATLGEDIALKLTFRNVCDHKVYLFTRFNVGKADIDIQVSKGECSWRTRGAIFCYSEDGYRRLFKKIKPGKSYSEKVYIQYDLVWSYIDEPRPYQITVTFFEKEFEKKYQRMFKPLFTGQLKAQTTLHAQKPAEDRFNEHLENLRTFVEDSSSEEGFEKTMAAAQFFRCNKSPEAGMLLVPYYDQLIPPDIIKALVYQKDTKALRTLLEQKKDDAFTTKLLVQAIAYLKEPTCSPFRFAREKSPDRP